jgi:hypothetical protein
MSEFGENFIQDKSILHKISIIQDFILSTYKLFGHVPEIVILACQHIVEEYPREWYPAWVKTVANASKFGSWDDLMQDVVYDIQNQRSFSDGIRDL